MKTIRLMSLAIACALFASAAAAQVTLYKQERFYGPAFTANGPVNNLAGTGFNDRASSMIVERGNWQVCEDSDFRGRCIELRPGQYPSLHAMGLDNRISSLRRVPGPNYSYAPPRPPPPAYPYYPAYGETLYQAPVVAVRAVTGPPEQRCWTEPQQVVAPAQPERSRRDHRRHTRRRARPPDRQRPRQRRGHGGGRGRRRGGGRQRGPGAQTYTQNVQRCTTVPGSAQVAYWDVTYTFRGVTHRAQLGFAPGATLTVNGRGEPRV